MARNWRHFKNDEQLIKELMDTLTAQGQHMDGGQGWNIYYDWTEWLLGKLYEVKDTANGIVNS